MLTTLSKRGVVDYAQAAVVNGLYYGGVKNDFNFGPSLHGGSGKFLEKIYTIIVFFYGTSELLIKIYKFEFYLSTLQLCNGGYIEFNILF